MLVFGFLSTSFLSPQQGNLGQATQNRLDAFWPKVFEVQPMEGINPNSGSFSDLLLVVVCSRAPLQNPKGVAFVYAMVSFWFQSLSARHGRWLEALCKRNAVKRARTYVGHDSKEDEASSNDETGNNNEPRVQLDQHESTN